MYSFVFAFIRTHPELHRQKMLHLLTSLMSTIDRCVGEKKERKTKSEMVGQQQERLVGEIIVNGGRSRPSSMEVSHKKHRPHIQNPYSMMFLGSTTKLVYMNSTPTGKMDSLTLCMPLLITVHTITNAMPKCCCDSNLVLMF